MLSHSSSLWQQVPGPGVELVQIALGLTVLSLLWPLLRHTEFLWVALPRAQAEEGVGCSGLHSPCSSVVQNGAHTGLLQVAPPLGQGGVSKGYSGLHILHFAMA